MKKLMIIIAAVLLLGFLPKCGGVLEAGKHPCAPTGGAFAVVGVKYIACPPPGGPTTTASTAATTTTTSPPGSFPNASNTGVPAGTVLTVYSGPTTITSCGTVIDSKIINGGIELHAGNNTQSAATPCLTIKNSLINGAGTPNNAAVEDGSLGFPGESTCAAFAQGLCGPIVVTDTEMAIANCPSCSTAAGTTRASYGPNIHATRVNIHGSAAPGFGQDMQQNELTDSWVHGNYEVTDNHTAAVAFNSGSTACCSLIQHNTLDCFMQSGGQPAGTGGCSATTNIYDQRSNSHDITYNNNYFTQTGGKGAGGVHCVYGGGTQDPSGNIGFNLIWENNVWNSDCISGPPTQGVAFTLWDATFAAAHNDKFCNNRYQANDPIPSLSGTLVAPQFETGGCP